ncbi:unnamed protein product [Protopolystoma xenopodis]|uniref:Uncharacterized protein n=1 Tax=Protopolystoma xenopodis TaxID=117903 RepID=A0A3S5FF32_9PLAT|nr:unnamed protein product [Protopolystoma xenopodis]
MAPLIDDADYNVGETFGNVPSQWPNAENHEYWRAEDTGLVTLHNVSLTLGTSCQNMVESTLRS